jgi:hypothetical protein
MANSRALDMCTGIHVTLMPSTILLKILTISVEKIYWAIEQNKQYSYM